jgi:hypothetical protein
MFRKFAYATLATLGLTLGTSTADAQWKVNIGFGPGGVSSSILPGYPNGGYLNGGFPGYPGGFHKDNHYHVQYRQLHWKERSFTSHFAAHQFENLKEREGYQAHVVHHGLHYHVRFRMPQWQTYRTVHSHSAAHNLEHYLEDLGFDARVVHH